MTTDEKKTGIHTGIPNPAKLHTMFVKAVRMGVNEGSGAGSILASLVEIYKDRSDLKPWFPTKEAIQRFKDATKRDDATKFAMETPADIKEFLQKQGCAEG